MLADVIIANLNRNFTGVTATLFNVVPHQMKEIDLAVYGPALGLGEPNASAINLIKEGHQKPKNKPFRIWHARRNTDLWRGLFYRDVLKMPLKILFTSAAQRRHSALPRWLLNRSDAVIATTEKAASYLNRVDAVIPHGIDLEAFQPIDDKIKSWQALAKQHNWPLQAQQAKYAIGQLGRIRPQKGTDIFVDALIKLLPSHPDAVGVITGSAMPKDKRYKKNLEEKIAQAGLSDRIIWTGQLSFESLTKVQQSLSLFVAAARREEFGLTPAEALACGTPIICSDTGAFAMMVVEGETGSLLPRNDPLTLAKTLAIYLDNPEKMHAMKPACRKHAEQHFAAQREAAAINEVYHSLWSSLKSTKKGTHYASC